MAQGKGQGAEEESHSYQGFVSIFSVMIIMAILTLVAIGFSNVTRRTQRNTLDKQLNAQAYYAAESGINDARAALRTYPTLSQTKCKDPSSPAYSSFKYDLDASTNTGYTCMLINSKLNDLVFDTVPLEGTSNPKMVAFESGDSEPIKSFDVTWDATGAGAGTTAIPNNTAYPNILTSAASWGNKLGMLRIDLAPTDGGLDRSSMATGSYTFFLYPSTGASISNHTVLSGSNDQSGLVFVKCASGLSPCKATINLSPGTNAKYMMRLQSIYNIVKVSINNVKNSVGAGITLQNGQFVIDVTGRAADVFKRIQVRVPVVINGQTSSFAVQSADSICKRLAINPLEVYVEPTGNLADDSGVCAINN